MEGIKNRLTDAEIRFKLVEIFESGITVYTECIESLRTKYTFSNERFAEIYTASIKEWSELKDIAQREAIHSNTVTSLTIGLKPKLERQLKIQSQIESIENLLNEKRTWHSYFFNGEVVDAERYLTPQEIAKYHSTIKELNAELSKMAGEYASTKIEANVIDDENRIMIKVGLAYDNTECDPSRMTDEQIKARMLVLRVREEMEREEEERKNMTPDQIRIKIKELENS